MNSHSGIGSDFTQHVYANGSSFGWCCCFNQGLVLISKMGKKRNRAMWWVMAESCLPCLCSSCACSTRYHFVPPSLATFKKPFCITLGAHNAASSTGFCCQGNRHPQRHPVTAQGERGGMGGRVRDAALALSSLQSASDLWHLPSTLPLQWNTQTKKRTKQQYLCTDMHTHRNTQAGARERNERKVRERKIPNFLIQSYHPNQCACD